MKMLLKKEKKESSDAAYGFTAAPKRKKRKKIIILAVCIVVVCAAAIGLKSVLAGKGSANVPTTFSTYTVDKRDITVRLSGSGTLQPADSYEVTSLASGEILSDSFQEGDEVEEGALLYQIDTADAQTSIRSAELSMEKSQLSYNNLLENLSDLDVTAPAAGYLMELNVEAGDSVSGGQTIGTIRNSATMCLTVPFISSDADSFSVGQSAEVTLDDTFETLPGKLSKISNVEQVLTGGMLVKYVTIDVKNPGGITDATNATARVGDAACSKSAAFTYKAEKAVTAGTSGEVQYIASEEGDYVSEGQLLVKLMSNDLEQQVKSGELSLQDARNTLENRQEALEDYTITSPIAGTIIEKNYKAGDKLDSNSGNVILCTIYDLGYLTMDLSVDELDVSKVKVGQEVTITADAAEGKTFSGVVTKVNISGTTSNGVTAYPVTIRIDETDGLLPGMNVDAEIVVESVDDVLSIPVEAVSRGNRVLVRMDGAAAAEATDGELAAADNGLPEGFEYVEVTLGVNNDDYIEVTSGLSEGDVIAYLNVSAVTDIMGAMQGGAYAAGPGGETVVVTTAGSAGAPPSGGRRMGG